MNYTAAPNDSRYVPFTQQPECCVPTSILMIMYRHGLPLMPAEELGYHLGLTVPPDKKHLFFNARSTPEPPSAAGYGTQIFNPQYDPNKVFRQLGIPLKFRLELASDIKSPEQLVKSLHAVEANDSDALLCFNHGVIKGEFKPHSGHVAVFDRAKNGLIRLVDASPKQPKWRLVDPALLFEAIQRHGNASSAGIWHFERA